MNNVSVVEGNGGTATARFTVSLSRPALAPVTATFATIDTVSWYSAYTAKAGVDYVARSGSLTFATGQTLKTVNVTIKGDTALEQDEQFTLRLTNATGAVGTDVYGRGTILDDESGSGFRIAAGDVSIREGDLRVRPAYVTATFSAPAPSSFVLTARTVAASADAADYVAATKTITVAKGVRSKIIPIKIRPNVVLEPTETFSVHLTSTLGTVWRDAQIEIRDDDQSFARAGRAAGPPRIAFIGDSITHFGMLSLKARFEAAGWAVFEYGTSGASPLDAARCAGQEVQTIIDRHDPDVIMFEYLGNYGWFASCNPTVTYGSQEFFSQWATTTASLNSIAQQRGATTWWALNPSVDATSAPARHAVLPTINAIHATYGNTIDLWDPFGGDPPNCALRAYECVHMNDNGNALMADLYHDAIID